MATVDTLRIAVEVDADAAIAKLQKLENGETALVGKSSAAGRQVDSLGNKFNNLSEKSNNLGISLAKLRMPEGGIDLLGFARLGGLVGALGMGLRFLTERGKEAEAMFNQLHPELADADGSAKKWKESTDSLTAAIGGLISSGLSPLRNAIIKNVVEPTKEAIKAMSGMEDGWQKIGMVGDDKTITTQTSKSIDSVQKQIGNLQNLINKLNASWSDSFVIPKDAADNLESYNTQLDSLKSTLDYLQSIQAGKSISSDQAWSAVINPMIIKNMDAARDRLNNDLIDMSEYIKEMADIYKSALDKIQDLGYSLSEFPMTLSNYKIYRDLSSHKNNSPTVNTESPISYIDIDANVALAMEAKELTKVNDKLKEYTDLTKHAYSDANMLSDALLHLAESFGLSGDKAKDAAAQMEAYLKSAYESIINLAYELGEAMGAGSKATKSAQDVMRDFFVDMLKQIPQMMFEAGLMLLFTPAWPLGVALIAASPFAGLLTGAIAGSMSANSSSGSGSYSGSSASYSTSNSNTTVFNVYGNVWTSEDIAAMYAQRSAAW